jgi:hypothetical protein
MLASVQISQPKILRSDRIPAESRIDGCLDAQQGDYPFYVQGDGYGGRLVWGDVVPRQLLPGRL